MGDDENTRALPAPAPYTAGRLAVLSSYAMALGAIPIPLLPDRMVAHVRGAVVQDVAARYGLSLTGEARRALAEASKSSRTRALAKKVLMLVSRQLLRRAGPATMMGSMMGGYEVFALGLLFERYVRDLRVANTLRITDQEAQSVRDAIDRASLRALSPSLTPHHLQLPQGAEDLRDAFTRTVDRLLLAGASLPGYLERRLEAAFDQEADAIRAG